MASSDSTGDPNIGRIGDIGDRFTYKENISPNYKGGIFHTREKVWGGSSSEADQGKSHVGGLLIPATKASCLVLNSKLRLPKYKHRSTKFKTEKEVLTEDNFMDDPDTYFRQDEDYNQVMGVDLYQTPPITSWHNELLKIQSAWLNETRVKSPLMPVDNENTKRGKAIVEEGSSTGKKRFRCEDVELYPTTNIRDRIRDIYRPPLKDKIFDLMIQDEMLENEYANKQKKWHSEKESLVYAFENFRKHNLELNNWLKEVSMERKWLIEEGFRHVVNNLLRSEECLGVFGELHSKLLKSEIQEGLLAGYRFCKRGVPIDRAILYRPQAEEDFKAAILEQLESINFPYLEAISACVNQPLSVLQSLEPRGLKREKVGLDVAATAGSGTGSTLTF